MIFKRPKLGRGGRPLRIAYGRIFHEACAHSPLLTGKESFLRMHHIKGAELDQASTLKGSELASFMPHAELTGFRQAARLAGNIQTVALSSSLAVPSGPLEAECFDWLVDDLCAQLEQAGEVDGVYLALHGSMQVDGLDKAPESLILSRVREQIGADKQLAVSYDLHANLSPGLVDPVDVLIGYRSNPHWDLAPTGFRAGNRLIRSLRGQCEPTHAWRKLPMVLGGGMTIDFLAPMRQVFRWMRSLEDNPKVLSASLFMVHPFTGADDLGWAAHVCCDGDQQLADELAEALADRAWQQRLVDIPEMVEVEDALEEVRSSKWTKLGPVTLVDSDDIVGAGAPGGNTHVVQAMVHNDRGLRGYIPVHDPALVEENFEQPLGETKRFTLRGTPGYQQPEVEVEATVVSRHEGEHGRRLRLDCGSFHIVVCDGPPLPIHPSYWSDLGLRARDADFIVQKNFFHYRMFYAATSFQHIPIISQGATSLRALYDRQYRVETYPQTRLDDWRAGDKVLRQNLGGESWQRETSTKATDGPQTAKPTEAEQLSSTSKSADVLPPLRVEA